MADPAKDVKIPASLHARIEKRLPSTGFPTVSDYVAYLIREVLDSIEREEKKDKKDFTPEEEREIEDRLRNLGYID
ncbi:MAG: CopG family transcriptional regulator [Candidatus Lokiarchaeota archaeon]|nr:CopG family transcriptional regulator [Candidatus Lokiarchaeota archaeon]